MSWMRLAIVSLFGASLTGCAAWMPNGAEPEPRIEPVIQVTSKNPATVQLVVDPELLESVLPAAADGHAGSACVIQFKPYAELYSQAQSLLAKAFTHVDVTTPDKIAPGYSLVLVPGIEALKWGAAGPSANAAAVKVQLGTVQGNGISTESAYIVAKANLGRWHRGCHDATVTATGAANRSIAFGLTKLVQQLATSELPPPSSLRAHSETEQMLLLAKIHASRVKVSAFTDTNAGNQQTMQTTLAMLATLQAIQATQAAGAAGSSQAAASTGTIVVANGVHRASPSMSSVRNMSMETPGNTQASVQAATPMTVEEERSYRAARDCVSFTSYRMGQRADRLGNQCSFPILVKWRDSGSCATGCADWGYDGIRPGKHVTITPIQPPFSYAACEYPGSPTAPSGTQWRGETHYYCK